MGIPGLRSDGNELWNRLALGCWLAVVFQYQFSICPFDKIALQDLDPRALSAMPSLTFNVCYSSRYLLPGARTATQA